MAQLLYEQNNVLFEHGCNIGELEICKQQIEFCTNIYGGFETACVNGHLHICKWIYEHNSTFYEHKDINHLFTTVCSCNNFNIVKWLYETFPRINIDDGFKTSYMYGYENICKYLYSLDNDVIERVNIPEIFQSVHRTNHTKLYDWLYDLAPNKIDEKLLKKEYDQAFYCNDLTKCKWIYKRIGKIEDIKDKFKYACKFGDLNIAQWIYSVDPSIKSCINDSILWSVCYNGHTDLFKWLLNICPKIDILYNHRLISIACERNILSIVEFIYEYYLVAKEEWENLSFWKRMITTSDYYSFYERIDEIFCEACNKESLDTCKWLLKLKPKLKMNTKWLDRNVDDIMIWLK
jgi:hypothetical protein